MECSQRFQFEFPYVAHLRFRCPKRLHGSESSQADESSTKDSSPKAQEGTLESAANKYHDKPNGGTQPIHPQQHPPPPPPPHQRHHYPGPQDLKSSRPAGGASKPSTDFHNLARELENSRASSASPIGREPQEGGPNANPSHGGGGGKAKRKYPAGEQLAERAPVAARGRVERPVPSSPKEELVCTPQQQYRAAGSYFGLEESSRLFGPPSPETGEAKRSAFVEVKKASRGPEGGDEEKERGSPGSAQAGGAADKQPPPPPSLLGARSGGSAFSTVPSSQPSGVGSPEERKSAFSQPARSTFSASSSASAHVTQLVLGQKLSALAEAGCHAGADGSARLYAPDSLAVKLQSAPGELNNGGGPVGGGGGGGPAGGGAAGGGGLPKQNPFLYATTFWPKSSAAAVAAAAAAAGPLQLQLPSALTLLPPSFTSLCLPAQNWCAKCNASFRMTSDLVYHMRSHHKKEYALEPLVKRRREEKLKCPICNESFRERHHLSRHMTSHN